MSYDLGVWHGELPLDDDQAGDLYVKLCEERWVPIEENAATLAFYNELSARYPEIDDVPEEDLDECPWSCAHDRSGLHVLMAMRWSKYSEVAPVVYELAEKHGLICYNPQEGKVMLPNKLKLNTKQKRPWFRF
jgi:hypothetical protein